MSCLSDFKVVAILGDKAEDMISENITENKSSFIKKFFKRIKNKFFKVLLGDLF